MPTLQFNTQNTRRQPIRTALSRFLTSDVRGMFEVSEGQRPAEVFYPYKHQRVRMLDTELEDGIVIPKGSIVSAMTYKNTSSPICAPASGSTVYVGDDATTSAATAWSASIDNSYWGYDDHVAGLLILANGGTDVTGTDVNERYTAHDVTVGTVKTDGTFVAAAAEEAPARGANFPIGVVTADVYQDIRGKYLNYDVWDKWGILCDWYVEVPYYDAEILASRYGYTDGGTGNNTEGELTTDNYYAVVDSHSFLYSYYSSATFPLAAGALVKSDKFGKYIPQYDAISTGTDGEYWTAQTVGRIIALDNRFPKDQLDVVDTYPGSGMPGTETGGLPVHLFNFVKDWLTNQDGSTPTISTIVAAVRTGAFGVARIQLHVG